MKGLEEGLKATAGELWRIGTEPGVVSDAISAAPLGAGAVFPLGSRQFLNR